MGQEETSAPQQAAPLFDHQTSGKPRRSPFPCILGRDRLPDPAREITDATAGVHRRARERGGVQIQAQAQHPILIS
jgi:hypothetical protein